MVQTEIHQKHINLWIDSRFEESLKRTSVCFFGNIVFPLMYIYICINHVEVWVRVFYQHFNMWIDPRRNISLIAVCANSCRITIKANSAQGFGNQSFHGFICFSLNGKQMKRDTWREIFPCGANVVDLAYIIRPAIMFLWQKEMSENLRHYGVHGMVFQNHWSTGHSDSVEGQPEVLMQKNNVG